jgi:integrase
LQNYQQTLRLHINPAIGGIKLAALTAPRVEQFRDELLRKGPAHSRKVLISLKGILKEARRLGYMSHDPAEAVSLGNKRVEKRKQRKLRSADSVGGAVSPSAIAKTIIPSKDEIRAILAHAKNPWRPLFVTAIFTGMRASELRGLTWDAVDFAKETIHVYLRADRWGVMGEPKSEAGDREIPMSPMVLTTLREWRLACPKGPLNLVFPTSAGNVHRHTNISFRAWAGLQRAAGVTDADGKPKYRFHLLRHFAASWMIESGFSPKRLQALMGHSSIQITMDLYGHCFPSLEDDKTKFAAAELSIVG